MSRFSKVLLVGSLIGMTLASWVAPPFLIWWYTPPANLALSCKQSVVWACYTLVKFQAVGLVVGIIFTLFIYYTFIAKKKPLPTTEELLKQ